MDTFTDRIESLEPFTHYGLSYRRGVADALAAARLFFTRGETTSAEHYLLLAELRAGLIDAEIFTREDPTGPTWVGVTGGLATWGGDGTSGTAQRDRVRAAFIASGFAWPAGRIAVRRSDGPTSDVPIALGILTATGMLDASTPRPTGSLGLAGRIGDTAGGLGANTLSELVKRYRRRDVGAARRRNGGLRWDGVTPPAWPEV